MEKAGQQRTVSIKRKTFSTSTWNSTLQQIFSPSTYSHKEVTMQVSATHARSHGRKKLPRQQTMMMTQKQHGSPTITATIPYTSHAHHGSSTTFPKISVGTSQPRQRTANVTHSHNLDAVKFHLLPRTHYRRVKSQPRSLLQPQVDSRYRPHLTG